MKTIMLDRNWIILGAAIWWFLFFIISVTGFNYFQVLNCVGFLTLVLLPGLLTSILLRVQDLHVYAHICLAIAFSLIELMCVTLLGNTLLPHIGISHPLGGAILLEEFSSLILGLLILLYLQAPRIELSPTFFKDRRSFVYAFVPIVFVVMAVVGAVRLNNGAGGGITVFMLVLMGVYIAFLAITSHRKGHVGFDVMFPSLYFISLSLLLMTSLRGWYTTGHDIQTEYFVFELTKNNGIWLIQNYKDAYNACMSITILPTIFSSLLQLSDPYVYKVLFQALFAIVPGVVYAIARKYVTEVIAFLAAVYFIAFPTFFADMPMLNRQEIAFIFWALMIYLLFEDRVPLYLRRIIFVVLGLGMVLSHYSTTYTVIAFILFVVIARPLVRMILPLLRKFRFFGQSMIEGLGSVAAPKIEPRITFWMAATLVAASFLWSSVLTDTSSNSIVRVFTETVAAIQRNTKEDARSSDVFYSLLSWGKPKPDAGLSGYERKFVMPARSNAAPDTFYNSALYEKYGVRAIDNPQLQPTFLGKIFEQLGFSVSSFNFMIRQVAAKILQVLIIIGLIATFFQSRFSRRIWDLEFILLTLASLLMVACQVILPVLSAEYGVLRAFQQSLMFLGVFVVIGSLNLFVRLQDHSRKIYAVIFAVMFFFAMTGVVTRVLVSDPPQLHLSNSGVYYNNYYLHRSEVAAMRWIANEVPKDSSTVVQTDRSEFNGIRTIPGIAVRNGIYPGLIRTDSYVFLGYSNVRNSESTVLWNSDVITYTYPVQFLDSVKDLVYANGSTKIYR